MNKALLLFLFFVTMMAQDQDILDELYTFLDMKDPNINSLIKIQADRKIYLRCTHNTLLRRNLKHTDRLFSGGQETCGWELKALKGDCVSGGLFNVQLILRKSLTPSAIKTTQLLGTSEPAQGIEVPAGRYVKAAKLGFATSGGLSYLTSVVLSFDDNNEKSLECSKPTGYKQTVLDFNERIDGMQFSYQDKKITTFDFYFNKILDLKGEIPTYPSTYNKLLTAFKFTDLRIEDKFFFRGPYGNKYGHRFEDAKFYDDWRVNEIYVETAVGAIASIQLKLTNSLFFYEVLTPIRGTKKNVAANIKKVVVPNNSYITWINIDFAPMTKRVVGLQFFFSNGGQSGCIGTCIDASNRSGSLVKDVYFSNKEYIVGFTGYESDKGLESLGFLIAVERGEDLDQYE